MTVREAMAGGVSFVCATCKRFWEGQARGLQTCTALLPCGGPMAKLAFPLYSGSITDMERYCFVCGEPPTAGAVRVPYEERKLGVCKKHVALLVTLGPVKVHLSQGRTIETRQPLTLIQKQGEGAVPLPPKTLAQVMAETEAEWATEDAYKAEERAKKCGR